MDALQDNFQALPDWLKHAYHNDGAVNRVVKEWRMTSKPLASLYESLAAKMYELKNHWEATAMHYAENQTPCFVIKPDDLRAAVPSENSDYPHQVSR